jgi:hypothetical protein
MDPKRKRKPTIQQRCNGEGRSWCKTKAISFLFFFACNKQSYLKLESKQQSYLFQRIGPTPRFLSSFLSEKACLLGHPVIKLDQAKKS